MCGNVVTGKGVMLLIQDHSYTMATKTPLTVEAMTPQQGLRIFPRRADCERPAVHGMVKVAGEEMAGVKFSAIEDAFLFVGSAPYGEHAAYLNVETGKIFYQ